MTVNDRTQNNLRCFEAKPPGAANEEAVDGYPYALHLHRFSILHILTAVDATTEIKAALAATGIPIGPNDTAFERVPDLMLEDWVK